MKNRNILVADERVFVRRLLRHLLSGPGYVVREARSIVQSIDNAVLFQPTLIVLGTSLSPDDPFEGLRVIKHFLPSTHTILTAPTADRDLVLEAVRAGADDFLVSPFDRERLMRSLQGALAA